MPRLAQHIVCPNSNNLNALSTQDCHDAIKFNDEELDSCWEKATVLKNLRSCGGIGSNAHLKLPSPYKEFYLKLVGIELSYEDLKLCDHYAALYLGEPGILVGTPNYASKEKGLVVVGKVSKFDQKRMENPHKYVDLKYLIVNYAQDVAVGDASVANKLLHHIHKVHGASTHGTLGMVCNVLRTILVRFG